MEKPIFFVKHMNQIHRKNSSLNSSACFARIPDMTKELKFLPWSARFRKQLTRKRLEKPKPIKNFEFGASVQSFCIAGQNSRATGPKWKTWLPWNSQSVPCLGASNTRDVIRQHELVQESWRARFSPNRACLSILNRGAFATRCHLCVFSRLDQTCRCHHATSEMEWSKKPCMR